MVGLFRAGLSLRRLVFRLVEDNAASGLTWPVLLFAPPPNHRHPRPLAMSAIRHNAERRNARSKLTHPYGTRSGKRRGSGDGGNEQVRFRSVRSRSAHLLGRVLQAKGWGITDFLFGFFKRSTPHYDVEEHGVSRVVEL